MKIRFTKKPHKNEGWYWLKYKNGDVEIGLALDAEHQQWSLCTDDGILGWDQLLARGARRSVKQIEYVDFKMIWELQGYSYFQKAINKWRKNLGAAS